jgi:hypothetical protein
LENDFIEPDFNISRISRLESGLTDISAILPKDQKDSDNQVHKIMKELEISSSPNLPKIKENLSKLNNFDYDIFELDDILETHTMQVISNEIFHRLELFDVIPEDITRSFINKIITGYNRNVTYHNDLHAADVLQTSYVCLTKGDLCKVLRV